MHPSLTLFSLLGLSLHVHAQAQNTVALTNALQRADLTTFASALERANRSEAGQHLLSELMDESKNYTLFAPDNAACEYLVHLLATWSAALGGFCIPFFHPAFAVLTLGLDICAF